MITEIPIKIQIVKSLSTANPSRIVAVKADNESAFSLFVTDKTGIPYPLKDLQNNVIITNTDGNLQITSSSTSTNINLAPSILVAINSALQSGDNISELINDVGYLTTFIETDPIFQASEASLFVSGDKANLDNQSGINSGNQTSIVGISGTKAQFNAELTDGDFLFVGDTTGYTNEEAQDAVGNILTDSTTIDFNYDDTTPTISANVKLNSIDATHLVDNINISEFTNDEGYITDVNLSYTPSTTNGVIVNDKGTDATISTVNFTNAGLLTPEEKQLLYNNSATGVTKFEGFSINVDTTKYNTGLIEGWFVDNATNPNIPTKVFKSFPATTGNTLTNIATQNVTYIAVDINGVHQQSGVPFEPELQRDWTPLGVIVHSNRTSINAINNQPVVALSPNNQLSDLMESISVFNIYGNVFAPNGINLSINKSAGQIFKQGSNFITNTKDPHTTLLPALIAPSNIRYRTQLGAESADTNVVAPNFWDNAGVITAMTGTRWSIQRIYVFQSNLVRIQYGQATYANLAEAIQSITTEAFVVEQNILENGLFRGLLIVRRNATDLTDNTRALFIEASKFGSVAGLGSLSTSNLQQAYNNSLTPEITTDSILGAFTLKRGSVLDTDNIFEGQNGAGVNTSSITGNGALTALTYNGYIPESITNKVTDFTTINNTLYPTIQAVKTYADNLVAGLLDDRGGYNASTNLFPTTGGSGTAGAVLKGDFWYVSVAGILGGQSVNIGDSFRALTDTPAQITSNWSILEGNLGYIPANSLVNISTTSPLLGGGNLTANRTLSIQQVTTSQSGFLSSTDWNVFNNKVSNATHTGDATGATALTLATVNSNVGSFGTASNVPQYTVNAKGLTTASANIPIQIAESQVINLVADLSNKQATLVSGTNIRTINGNTLLGATDLTIPVATDATTLAKGIVQLAGDLAGTSALPTVPGLALKANLASPTFTGVPLAPTATAGTNTTQIATTAFVTGAIATADSGNVKTTGTQTIAGLKTFSESINANDGINFRGFLFSNFNAPFTTLSSTAFARFGNRLTFINDAKAISLNLDNITSLKTFSVPDQSGTFALTNNPTSLTATSFINSTAPATNALLANGTTLANPISGTGTTGYLPKFTSSGVLGNSIVNESATMINVAGAARFKEGAGTHYAEIGSDTNYSYFRGGNSGLGTLVYDIAGKGIFMQPFSGNLIAGGLTDNLIDRVQSNGSIIATQYKISSLNTAPASATATGTTGEIRITAGFIYICIATNTWVRAALITWI